jgi:hypothetical protein
MPLTIYPINRVHDQGGNVDYYIKTPLFVVQWGVVVCCTNAAPFGWWPVFPFRLLTFACVVLQASALPVHDSVYLETLNTFDFLQNMADTPSVWARALWIRKPDWQGSLWVPSMRSPRLAPNIVLSTEVSTLFPRVVISSLAKRLENLLFTILYASFGVWPRDHYM